MINDEFKSIEKEIERDIDFILKGKVINKKNIDKTRLIIFSRITVYSHRQFKFGAKHTGIRGHSTRITIRKELISFMNDYLKETLKSSQTNEQTKNDTFK